MLRRKGEKLIVSSFLYCKRESMLKKAIVCVNLGLTVGQQASNSMNLGLPPQVKFYFEIKHAAENWELKFGF